MSWNTLMLCQVLHGKYNGFKNISSKFPPFLNYCFLVEYLTPGKNNLFRKSNAWDNELCHENGCVKSSSQVQGEHWKCSSDFFPSECPGLCRSWLDDFTQLFSWRSSLSQALDFLNKLFLPGVLTHFPRFFYPFKFKSIFWWQSYFLMVIPFIIHLHKYIFLKTWHDKLNK